MGEYVPVIHASLADRPDESDTLVAAAAVREALVRLGCRSEVIALDLDFSVLERLVERRPRAVFNLVEAVRGEATLAHLAPALLAHLGLPFTGCGPAANLATMSKLMTKQALRARGLPTPDWWAAVDASRPNDRVIVKSVWEHASYGMDAASVVPAARAAAEIACREERFGGEFFAERFLPGREFNVALLSGDDGPQVLPVQEIGFDGLEPGRPPIVDYEAKWDESSAAFHATPRRFGLERREPVLASRLAELALECWRVFGLAGYARVDFRTDGSAQPFILEINTNPCITPDAGFIATASGAGLSYDAVIHRILAAAGGQGRRGRKRKGKHAANN